MCVKSVLLIWLKCSPTSVRILCLAEQKLEGGGERLEWGERSEHARDHGKEHSIAKAYLT